MSNPTPKRPKLFIESKMPVQLLNEQVYYEHGGNPFKGLHRWYSRKPLSFSRASVLASLLPADVTMAEFEYLLGMEPGKEIKLYKTPPSSTRIKKVHDYCEKIWGTRTPTVLDAFAGGGSIPFEAARYGLNVLASDLNPVAVVTMKAAMEYPLKFGPDLQQDIDKWVKWVGDEAEKRLAEFFPSLPGETVQNYLWAHTVVCPSCESVVPLSPNWWLYKRPEKQNLNKWCAVKPIPNPENKRVDFELVKGRKGKGTTIIPQTIKQAFVEQASSLLIPSQSSQDSSSKFSTINNNRQDACSTDSKNPINAPITISKRYLPHWELNGSIYFITFNTWEKLELTPEARKVVLDACLYFHNQRYKIYTIAVMPDHVHFLLEPLPKSENEYWSLSSILHSIKSYSSKQIPKVMKHIGIVWQDERYDRIVRDQREFTQFWNYIRENPVKASISNSPEEYPFFWQLDTESNQPVLLLVEQPFVETYTVGTSNVEQASSLLTTSQNSQDSSSKFSTINNNRQDACSTKTDINFQAEKEDLEEYNPDDYSTVSRGVGKCPNCRSVIEDDVIKSQAQAGNFGYQLYAVAYKQGKGSLEFRIPEFVDFDGIDQAEIDINQKLEKFNIDEILPKIEVTFGDKTKELIRYGIDRWDKLFNPRQLLTLVTYVEIINEAKALIQGEYDWDKGEAIVNYLAFVLDRCVDHNSRLSGWHSSRSAVDRSSKTHALNLSWNYPENNGSTELWFWCADAFASDYKGLCGLFGTKPGSTGIPEIEQYNSKSIKIDLASADNLTHIPNNSVDAVITDPPYYSTIQYAELSDFFYVWLKRTLGDIFPELFYLELTDKDREAVANPSRFRNMGVSPEELANQDYEAKMAMAFSEYHRVLRDDGVMTVQFNHKDSGAWDVLAKSLIDAGFEITASWAVSTENPQNLHQAQKNAVSSTVLLVCRKRDPNAAQAWWDDVRIDVRNIVFEKAPEIEKSLTADSRPAADRVADPRRRIKPPGIDLCLTAYGSALSVFTKHSSILDSAGNQVEPKAAFEEVRQAIVAYRLQNLLEGKDFNGIDPLTQWYILAWDTFEAREFPFDEARQLALAVGGFDVSDLVKKHKLIDSASGFCKLLTPQQRLKKRAFSVIDTEFSARFLVDGLHAIIAIYEEEGNIEPVRRFMKSTGLVSNDLFMRSFEVALKVIPRIGDEKKRILEEKYLLDLWLSMDEIKAKVSYQQVELQLNQGGQMTLDLSVDG